MPKPPRALHTVLVSFTPLHTAHLPARQRREVELKASQQEQDQLQLEVSSCLQVEQSFEWQTVECMHACLTRFLHRPTVLSAQSQ